jgi:hypothetical protein
MSTRSERIGRIKRLWRPELPLRSENAIDLPACCLQRSLKVDNKTGVLAVARDFIRLA